MASSSEGSAVINVPIEVLFEHDVSSSEDPPREQWSSLLALMSEPNLKVLQAAEGLYDPGSGEICAKYIAMSRSSLLLHPYYKYPAVLDPGIKHALFNDPGKVIYTDDGQELYLDECKKMGICVCKLFYRQILEDTVDLRYYGVSTTGIRPMAMALTLNKFVKVLNFTDNWIDQDSCFHLGEMLATNTTITELNLSGCKIGPDGARRIFYFLPRNHSVSVLNLSRNELCDEGVVLLAKAVFKGADVTNINLSYNNLTSKCIESLVLAFETHNKFTHLNLSANMIMSPKAISELCQKLAENHNFQELDLSWNSLKGDRVANGFQPLAKHPSLRRVYLRNNFLEGLAIGPIAANLTRPPKLEVLDLSCNPMSPLDALILLNRLKVKRVKMQQLILEHVIVDDLFVQTLHEILQRPNRKNTVVIYGGVRSKLVLKPVDMREIAMNRADALARKRSTKRLTVDIALLVLELFKEANQVDPKQFDAFLASRGLKLGDDLLYLLADCFPGSRAESGKNVNLVSMVDYVKRKWPDKTLPPTPPPPPPPQVPKSKEKKK